MADFDEHELENRGKSLVGLAENTEDLFLTPWSFVHFLSGAACKGMGWDFWMNFALHGMYELKDHMSKDENYNSTFNSAGDQFCSMVGFIYADRDIKWLYYWGFAYGFAYAMGKDIG